MVKNYYRLTEDHKNILKQNPLYENLFIEFRDGWFNLINDLGNDIKDLCDLTDTEYPTIHQVKEKFGTLRFYYRYNGENEIVKKCIKALVSQASSRSATICENCGEEGELVCLKGRWETVCDEHKQHGSISVEKWKQIH